METTTASPADTQQLGHKLGQSLTGGEVIALFGDLGSGKTTFVQGLAKGLKIKKRILSPTFVFMRAYQVLLKGQNLTFYHIDLYRGESDRDFKNLGLDEIISGESIVALEWAEKVKKVLPKKRIEVYFTKINDKKRRIKIDRRG